VLGWLRRNVHQRGHTVDAPQLFRETVGDRDPVADLMGHLRERHGALYGV
jgi:Zn-dependent M32 family carboxypeptidase